MLDSDVVLRSATENTQENEKAVGEAFHSVAGGWRV
jgi:hypothetical protein